MRVGELKHRIRSRVRRPSPRKFVADYTIRRAYARSFRPLALRRSKNTKLAVVVHLYYTESWPLLSSKLAVLNGRAFDVYVTLPSHNTSFAPSIRQQYPEARIVEVPNRGRDVLPFIMVARQLQQLGYEYVLKLHSKKSTHRTDGSEWLSELVTNLLPSNQKVLAALLATLDQPDTGVIGPAGQYLPLTVNFDANGMHMTRIVNKTHTRPVSYDVLQKQRSSYGFFAGTMFWIRLDAVKPLLDTKFGPRHFETEAGQIDGTIAHALERLFGVIPEIESKKMYEISTKQLKPVAYDAGVVPDWSDIYIGPKPD